MQTSTQDAAGKSLRYNPQLAELLKQSESRQLNDTELSQYTAIVPLNHDRAEAAREIAAIEAKVVKKTVDEIFAIYPFERMHGDYSPAKCLRDVTYVSAYATQAMLIDDAQWLNDKMLYWMRTIVQAFEFPQSDDNAPSTGRDPGLARLVEQSKQYPGYVAALYATYSRLGQNYRDELSIAAWVLLEPLLQQSVDVLTSTEV